MTKNVSVILSTLRFSKAQSKGTDLGAEAPDDVINNPAMKQAYEMGKGVKKW